MISSMEKQKMPIEKKLKLIYSGELAIFAVVFAVLGILFLTEVIKPADWKRYVFTYLTLAGGLWLIADFVWTLASKKRRAKHSLLDKCLVLPVAPILISFDIYCIINGCAETLPYRWFIGVDFCYLSLVYAFQAIYHYYKPTRQMQDIIADALAPEPEVKDPKEKEGEITEEIEEKENPEVKQPPEETKE